MSKSGPGWTLRLLLGGTVLAVAHPLLAQTTGRISGQTEDAGGQGTPGATVTVRSENLQGVRSVVTDARGTFLFPFLPPGSYDVAAALPGFQTTSLRGVRVDIDRTATVRLRLELATRSETVDVTAPPSEIDVTNTTTGVSAKADLYERIPLERSFFAIARVAPGTQRDETGSGFYGSTGLENQYVIDGLNVTGMLVGAEAKDLNFDFVEEVEVKTGGLPAEYGRTTGGILNVLTKSGGNTFQGSAFGFLAGGRLRSDNQTASQRPTDTTTIDDTPSKWDFGVELGGRIVRDRLWFFGAFNRVAENSDTTVIRDLATPGAPEVGSVVSGQQRTNRFAAKLTWRPLASSTLALSLFGDPNWYAGPVAGINGPSTTYLGKVDGGGTNLTARYEGTFGGTFLVRALFGQHRQSGIVGGPGTDMPRVDDYTVDPPTSTGGLGGYGNSRSARNVGRLDLSKVLRSHELKIGGDVEDLSWDETDNVSGGDYVAKLRQDGLVDYLHSFYVNDRAPGFDRNDPSTWLPALFVSKPHTINLSAYAQDLWHVHGGLTLSLGLRFERQDLKDRDGKTPLTVSNWAPRVGVAWDVKRDGRSKLYASFSRYFENIPQLIQLTSFTGSTGVNSFNFDPTPGSVVPDPAAPQGSGVWGGQSSAVDPGLKGQYVDEWLLGFERELRPNLVVGLKGGWRPLGRVIEDINTGSGNYLFGNPGEGQATTIAFFDGSSVPSPRAQRDNYSLEASARKRLSRGWQVLASYVWTRLRGNYDGSYQRSTGQGTPNWNSGFDWADFLVNAYGPLTSESVHQCKLDGSYEVLGGKAKGLNVGLSTHWYSGIPENAYGFSANYFNGEHYLVPRGTVGRQPADYEIDLLASYPIHLGKTTRLLLQADVFNLLNRQSILRYDERYNLIQDGACAGVPEGLCTADGGLRTRPGTLEPIGSIGDPRATATNPDYLKKGGSFTGPRSLRLGVRLSF